MPTTRPSYLTTVLLCTLCLLTGCHPDDDLRETTAYSHLLRLPLAMAMAGDDGMPATRTPGDPGTAEPFRFPRWAYVYLVVQYEDGHTLLCPTTNSDGDELAQPIDVSAHWSKSVNRFSTPQTFSDSIYLCSTAFFFKVKNEDKGSKASHGRVYLAATYEQLPNLSTVTPGVSTETDMLGITFDAIADDGSHNISAALQDLYATPYNYYDTGGHYYGTVNNVSATSVEQHDIMLYHVAAKVDVMWNVAAEQQSTLSLSYMETRRLKQRQCLLFRPTENTWTSDDDDHNYAQVLLDGDVSRQWYGRAYYYAIPYKRDGRYYDISLHILKNGDSKTLYAATGYNLTIHRDLSGTQYSVFTPWLRPDLLFTRGVGSMEYSETIPVNIERNE